VKKILMILLAFVFCLGILYLFLVGKRNMVPPSVSLPLPTAEPTMVASPSATPMPDQIIFEVRNDLGMIESDLEKIKEDNRLNPPTFIFDLGIPK